MIGDWDQSFETAQRVLQFEENNLIALKIQVFHHLAREGNIDVTCEKLIEINRVIDQREPRNTEFMMGLSKLLSRICGRNKRVKIILRETKN